MKQFLIDEVKKTLAKIKETDPSTSAYHAALQTLEYLNGMAETIEIAVDIADGEADSFIPEDVNVIPAPPEMQAGGTGPQVVEFHSTTAEEATVPADAGPAVVVHADATVYTKADLRKALYAAKEEGVDITELLGKYGAKNVNDVKEADYAEIIGMYGGV